MKESVGVVKLEKISGEQERKKESEASPHPGVETFDGDVHIVPLAERLQPVQNPLLVPELQILHHTCNCENKMKPSKFEFGGILWGCGQNSNCQRTYVDVENHELRPEQVPRLRLRPDDENS